jgi:hypothetical protein
MARLSSAFRSANVIRKERALTNDELMRYVPSVFSEDKHASRSERYAIYTFGRVHYIQVLAHGE